jgi:hypothetical protein
MWRIFFREYLRYVSALDPNYDGLRKQIRDTMNQIKGDPVFKAAFLGGGRATRDFRKFQEFVNLCKGFARLNGEREVSETSLWHSHKIFMESMATLEGDAGWKHIINGANERIAMLYGKLWNEKKDGIYESLKEMMDVVTFSEKEWDELVNLNYINPNGNKFKGKWSSWVEIIDLDAQP